MATETTTQQPTPKLRKVYDYLLSQRKVRPGRSYEEFEERMQDPERLQKVYDYLKEQNKVRAETFDAFQETMGVKKKDQGLPGGIPMAPEPDQQTLQTPVDQPQVSGEISSPVLESGLTEEQERDRNLAELAGQPVANDQAGTIPYLDPNKVTGSQVSPEDQRAKTDFDRAMQRAQHENVKDFVNESLRESHPEDYQEQNPLVSLGKSIWNIAANTLPSTAASALAAVSEGSMLAQMPETAPPGTKTPTIDETREQSKAVKSALLEYANEQGAEGSEYMKRVVNSMDKINDPIDLLNYVFSAAGNAAGQIPLSVATAGGSSIMQEVGSIYLASVNKIAQEKGLTVEQVINQNLDEPGYALAYGTAAGILDRFAAGKVMGSFNSSALKQAMRSRALSAIGSGAWEAGTEYTQTWLEQIGASHASPDNSFTAAIQEVASDPEKRKERIEGFVQGLIGGTAISGAGVGISALHKPVQAPTVQKSTPGPDAGSYTFTQPQNAPNVSGTTQSNAQQPNTGTEVESVQQPGPGQDLAGLKRSVQASPVSVQQSTNPQANVGKYEFGQRTESEPSGSPVSIPAEQRADIPAGEGQDIPQTQAQVPDGGATDQAPDIRPLDEQYEALKNSEIETIRTFRERWSTLSDDDKQRARQLAENWQMADLLPKEGGAIDSQTPKQTIDGPATSDTVEQQEQADTPAVPPVDESVATDEGSTETVQPSDQPFSVGTEVEFEWLGRNMVGTVDRYQHQRAHIRTKDGTSYPINPAKLKRVDPKKNLPRDTSEVVKHNSRRKKPIGIIGDPSSGFMFMTDLGEKITDFFKKQFTSKGFLPKDVFDRWIGAKGEISKWENQIKFTVSDFKKSIKQGYGKTKLTDDQITDLNLYLQGKQNLNPIPPEVADQLDVMRAQIDHLSQKFIDEGVVSGDLAATFTQNLGVYLTRSYRKHDDPFWAEFVDPQVRNKAEAFIRNNATQKGQQITPEEVDGLINFILHDPQAPMAVLKGSKLGSKDLSILKKRGDIAPEIRALMGEHSDPLLNYARSVTKMINLISKFHFLNDVKANGTGRFLFDKPTGKYHVKIAADASKTMAPLNGMYTSQEIADAFAEFNSQEPMGPWLRTYMKVVSMVKANKTVFSVQTHARNIVGNLGFVVMNGHWRVNKAGKAVQTAWAQLYNSDKSIRDKYLEYVQLGVVQDSASGGELRQYIKDIRDGKDFFETLGQRSMAKGSRKILEGTQAAYQAEDDMFKIYAYENEFARYRKAYPNRPVEEVKRIAADIVRNTYPTYSMVPKVIKGLRANPLVGTFVSFPAEVFRTTYNTLELAVKEMTDPQTRDIGVLRAAGIMSAFLLPTAASMFTMYANGLDGDDDDDLRKFAAPWQKDSEFLYQKVDGDKYTIIDLGYSDPHNYLKRPIYQFLSEGPMLENGIDAATALARPFLDENMLSERIVDIHRNKKATGDHVYNPDAPVGDKLASIYAHLWPVTEPGTIASLRRIRKGMLGETDKYGKAYDSTGEIISVVTGQKEETKDITQALLYRAYELKDRIEATEKDFFRVEKNLEATAEQKENAARIRQEATDKILADAKDIYLSAIRLGVDPKIARRYMILTRNEKIWRATAGAK